MKIASDIANLLGRFGANANGYLEVENTVEYKELPKPRIVAPVTPVMSDAAPAGVAQVEDAPAVVAAEAAELAEPSAAPLAVVNAPDPAPVRVEPVIEDLPVVVAVVAARLADVAEVVDVADVAAPLAAAEPVRPAAAPAAPVSAAPLRSLLSEAALKRESLARAQNEDDSLPHSPNSPNAAQPATPAQVIAVVSPKGGVGKTTLAAALAGALQGRGRVIAIDLDPQDALQHHLGAASAADIHPLPASAEERWSPLLRAGVGSASVLAYRAICADGPRALEQRIQKDRHWLARQLARMNLAAEDIVIVDTPAGRTPYLDQALDAADQVVVVLTPDAASFMAMDHMGALLEGRDNCRYVVNQFDASRTFSQDMLEVLRRRFEDKLIGVVPLDHAIAESLAYGANLLLEPGKSPAWQEVQSIGGALAPAVATAVEMARTSVRAS